MFPTNEEAKKLCGKISKQEFWSRYSIPSDYYEYGNLRLKFQIKRILYSISQCIIDGVETAEIAMDNQHEKKIKTFFRVWVIQYFLNKIIFIL